MSVWPRSSQHAYQEGANPPNMRLMDQPAHVGGYQAHSQGPTNKVPFNPSTQELASNMGSHLPVTSMSSGKAAAQTWLGDSNPAINPNDYRRQDVQYQQDDTPGNSHPLGATPSYPIGPTSHHSGMSWGATAAGSAPSQIASKNTAMPLRSPSYPSVPSHATTTRTYQSTSTMAAEQPDYERKLAKSDPSLHQAMGTQPAPRSAPFPKVEGFDYYAKASSSSSHPGHSDSQLFSLSSPVDNLDFVDIETSTQTSMAYRSVASVPSHPSTQMRMQNFHPSAQVYQPMNAQAPRNYPQQGHHGTSASHAAAAGGNQTYSHFAPQSHPSADSAHYMDENQRAQYLQMQQYGYGYSQASQYSHQGYPPAEGYQPAYPPREQHYGAQHTPLVTPRSPHSAGSSSSSRSPLSGISGLELNAGHQGMQRGEIDDYESSMLPHKRAKQFEIADQSPMPSYTPSASNDVSDDTSSDTAGYWTPQS